LEAREVGGEEERVAGVLRMKVVDGPQFMDESVVIFDCVVKIIVGGKGIVGADG
jgi:hypothetical protein